MRKQKRRKEQVQAENCILTIKERKLAGFRSEKSQTEEGMESKTDSNRIWF